MLQYSVPCAYCDLRLFRCSSDISYRIGVGQSNAATYFSRSSSQGHCYQYETYQKHAEFLSNKAHVSLTINTDGVAIFKSSKTGVWPVWLVINELPKEMR